MDYKIIHRGNCGCVSGGYVQDGMFADWPCTECEEPFGFNVPVTIDEGMLRSHLSCQIEFTYEEAFK